METKIEEIWKDVVGYEGYYQVSSLGRVKSTYSTKEKILSQSIKSGYCRVLLYRPGSTRICAKVHRIVALAFIPNHYNKPEVNHINSFKSDNRITNLEWVTKSENQQHASANGLPRKKHKKHEKRRYKPFFLAVQP